MPKNRETQTSVGKALMFKKFDYEIEGQEKTAPLSDLNSVSIISVRMPKDCTREIKQSDFVRAAEKRMKFSV